MSCFRSPATRGGSRDSTWELEGGLCGTPISCRAESQMSAEHISSQGWTDPEDGGDGSRLGRPTESIFCVVKGRIEKKAVRNRPGFWYQGR